MTTLRTLALLAATLLAATPAAAQRPPSLPMISPASQLMQLQAIAQRRHQARTQLYRDALEELKRNPRAADYAECAAGADACVPPAREPAPLPADLAPATRTRHAVLIGNNGYQDPIPALETPIADVKRIGGLLQSRYGYQVTVIENASKAAMARALNALAAKVGPEDSVLVFYAGHGYLHDDTNMGYWLPVDASPKSPANWISNADISRFLAAIPARQVILVSDSCFSGTLTRELQVSLAERVDPAEVLRRRSVLVFTSGGEEPVSDEGKDGHSLFAWHLIRTLDSVQGLAPGARVFSTVRDAVRRDFPQTPQYGAAVSAGHAAGGEYLFEARGAP